MIDIDEYVIEADADVIIALGECYLKETLINSIIMEETKPTTSRWDRIRGWLAKVGEWFRNAISWILGKLGGLFKKQNQINSAIQQTEASNTELPKIDPQKYPHIVFTNDNHYNIRGVRFPKSFDTCCEYALGYKGHGLFEMLDNIFEKVEKSFDSGQPPRIDDGQFSDLSSLYQLIDKCNELLSSVKSDDINDLTEAGKLVAEQLQQDTLNDINSLTQTFKNINDKLSKLSPEDKQKYDNVIDTITKAYQKVTQLLQQLMNKYKEIYTIINSELDQLSAELPRNNGNENQTNQNDQRTPEQKLWDEFKSIHPAQDGETPDQYKQRVSKMWEKYKNNPENQNRFNQGNGMLDKFKKKLS